MVVLSQHALQVSRPTPRVEVEGDLAWGGLQAHTREGCLLQGGGLLPGDLLLGVLFPGGSAPGGSAPRLVCSWGVWRPPVTAAAAGGTHPTGMYSCYLYFLMFNLIIARNSSELGTPFIYTNVLTKVGGKFTLEN